VREDSELQLDVPEVTVGDWRVGYAGRVKGLGVAEDMLRMFVVLACMGGVRSCEMLRRDGNLRESWSEGLRGQAKVTGDVGGGGRYFMRRLIAGGEVARGALPTKFDRKLGAGRGTDRERERTRRRKWMEDSVAGTK